MNDIERAFDYIKNLLGKSYIDYENMVSVTIPALEKQIPKKPIGVEANLLNRYCPSCHEWMIFEKISKVNYCPTCGQALAWE